MRSSTAPGPTRWLVLVLVAALSATAQAQEVVASIKAAFIYNFVKYVEWPPKALESPNAIVIGIVGRDSLEGELEKAVEGRTAGGRRLLVRHVHWGNELNQCNLLFVPAGEMGKAAQLSRFKSLPVLTIGESSGFARRTGIINFVVDSDQVCFEINPAFAREAGLKISSKLLSLGKAPGN